MEGLILAIYVLIGMTIGVVFLRTTPEMRKMFVDSEDDFGMRILGWMMIGCFTLLAGALWPLIVLGKVAMIGVKK